MKTSQKVTLGIGALVLAAAVVYRLTTTVIDTTKCYVNQAGVTSHLQSTVGHTYGIGSAHGVCIVGEDGVCYGLVDQCPIAGPETRYQRPGVNAGSLAQAWWDFYWTGPLANQNRCYMLPAGRTASAPPTGIGPCNSTVPCVPHAPAASGSFNPVIFTCGGDPTPSPVPTSGCIMVTVTPLPQYICVTPTRTP